MHKNPLSLPFQFPEKKPVHGIFCVRIKLFSTERFIFFFNLFTVGESTPHAGRRIVFSVGTEIQTVIAVRLFQFSVKTAEGFPSMAGIIFCGEPSDRCPGFDDFFEVNFPGKPSAHGDCPREVARIKYPSVPNCCTAVRGADQVNPFFYPWGIP